MLSRTSYTLTIIDYKGLLYYEPKRKLIDLTVFDCHLGKGSQSLNKQDLKLCNKEHKLPSTY